MINSGTKKITVLLPSDEAEQIKQCAAASGLTQNEWLRRALIKASGAMNNRKDDRHLLEYNIVYSKMIIELLIHKSYPPEKRGTSFANLWNFAVKKLNAWGFTKVALIELPAQSLPSRPTEKKRPEIKSIRQPSATEEEEIGLSISALKKVSAKEEKKPIPDDPAKDQTQEQGMDPALWHHIQQLKNGRGM